MALSMDEQRMLAEIERRLAAEDPALAARMSTFRRPGPVNVFRSARARVIGSLLTVAVVAMVSLMVYAILPFRSGSRTPSHQPVTTVSSTGQPRVSAGSGKGSAQTSGQQAHAGTSAAAKPASQAAGTSQSPVAHASSSTAHAASGSGTSGIPSTFTGP